MTTTRQQLDSARSLLFVPGDRPDRYDKAATSGAGVVIVDLEDAVVPTDKNHARAEAAQWLQRGHDAVLRINPPGTPWFDADLEMAVDQECPIMIPKADSGQLAEVMEKTQSRCSLIPLIETAAGVEHATEVCATTGTVRIAFGNVDLAAQLGISQGDQTALAYARSCLVIASAAANLAPPIDGVTLATQDRATVAADVAHARRLGFTAKLCIHPAQIPPVSEGFAPSETEREWAKTVTESAGSVTQVNGEMIDKPVLERARRILAMSEKT